MSTLSKPFELVGLLLDIAGLTLLLAADIEFLRSLALMFPQVRRVFHIREKFREEAEKQGFWPEMMKGVTKAALVSLYGKSAKEVLRFFPEFETEGVQPEEITLVAVTELRDVLRSQILEEPIIMPAIPSPEFAEEWEPVRNGIRFSDFTQQAEDFSRGLLYPVGFGLMLSGTVLQFIAALTW